MRNNKHGNKTRSNITTIAFAVMITSMFFVTAFAGIAQGEECDACSARPPPEETHNTSSAPGYCTSHGGSHWYEYISSVTYTQNPGGTMTITVDIYIANPTGCTYGSPCPEYDFSPEYVNVWVDWDGDKVFESGEKVIDAALTGYSSLNYHGTMTTSKIVTIPPDAVSSTWMRANLGWGHDPNNPCEYSWTWGDIVDKEVELLNIKVVQLDALNDVAIKDISDPIWKKQFDADGNLVDVTPKEDDPIADDMKSGSFKIKATLDAFPNKPSWNPKVSYNWYIFSVIPDTIADASGTGEFTGWNGEFDITLPQKVGQYDIFLEFTFKDNQNNVIGSQSINRKLYITYDNPILSPPKEIWLEKSTAWATGATTPSGVTSTLTQGIYTNSGWLYRDGATSWQSLVEGLAAQGNCVSFSNVWNNLNKVLGVSGSSTQRTWGSNNKGFMTKPATSLDGMQGNAHPPSGSIDRWKFYMHQVGRYAGGYYDPTFGNQYSGIFDFIEWHQISDWYWDSSVMKMRADLTGGHKVYLINTGGNNGWGDFEYYSPSNPSNVNTNNGATFTGTYTEYGMDSDGDGVYNSLTVDVEVDVKVAGDYSIFGLLKSDGITITSRSSKDSTSLSGYYLSSEPGLRTVTLIFSGQDIYDSGIDGVYTLDLVLLDENGIVIDQISFDTSAYNHAEFGEIPAEIESSTDYGEDTDSDGLYDYLSAEISIKVIRPMKYSVEGVLYSNEDLITTVYSSADLSIGTNTMELNFEGTEIWKSKFDGPFTLVVILHDENYHQIDYKEYTTSAYSYTDFQQPSASFRDIYSDYGMDTDGDGLYNYLTTEAEVNILAPGTYTILGWLSDASEESDIIWDSGDIYLDAGVQSMQLNFDGMAIYKHGTDGPYTLSYLALYDENGNLVDYQHGAYTTSAYSYTDFQKPEGLLVELTGNYNDYGTDTDSDGLFDYLTVDVEVIPANAGNVVASARLMDSNGEEIIWATNTAWLDAGLPQNIQLNFDGRYIYGNMVDGPYYVRDVYVYHTGDPTLPDYVYDAHTTAAYSYTEFEGSGVITGTVADAGMPVQNAFISISGGDSDYTNAAGEYNLVVLQDGTYTVNIEATGYDSWKIFVNSEYVTDGNSVDVSASIGAVTYVDFTQEVVDTEPPTIESVTLDAYTTIPDANIHVTVEATDNVGVTSLTVDGTDLVETGSTWEGDITAPSTTGDYTLTIKAEDAAGNFAETTVDYSVVTPVGGLGVAILPKISSASAGSTLPLDIKIVSTENFDDVLHVYLTLVGIPPDYQADIGWFDWTETTVQAPAGGEIMLPIAVDIPDGTSSGYKSFGVKVESTRWSSDAQDYGAIMVS